MVLTREEFIEEIKSRVKKPSELGQALDFVQRAFWLQNDLNRPCYILETARDIHPDDVTYLQQCMEELGTAAVLVPPKLIEPVAMVTPDSMKMRNIKQAIYSKRPIDKD